MGSDGDGTLVGDFLRDISSMPGMWMGEFLKEYLCWGMLGQICFEEMVIFSWDLIASPAWRCQDCIMMRMMAVIYTSTTDWVDQDHTWWGTIHSLIYPDYIYTSYCQLLFHRARKLWRRVFSWPTMCHGKNCPIMIWQFELYHLFWAQNRYK